MRKSARKWEKKWRLFSFKATRSMSLIESVVGVALLGTIAAVLVGVTLRQAGVSFSGKNKSLATAYANEAMETLRKTRDNMEWFSFVDPVTGYATADGKYLKITGGNLVQVDTAGGEATAVPIPADNFFTRTIFVKADTLKKVTAKATVVWEEKGELQEVVLDGVFTNWQGFQRSVFGKIIDAAGQAVANTTVRILGADGVYHSTKTDENGYFFFDNLSSGTYTLLVEGYGQYQIVVKTSDNSTPPLLISPSTSISGIGASGQLTGGSLSEETTPRITKLSQDSSLSTETNVITITGSNFTPQTRVYLGDRLLQMEYISATKIKVIIPAGLKPGVYDLVVWNDLTFTIDYNAYTIEAAPSPEITSIRITSYNTNGSANIQIKGKNFYPGMIIKIDGVTITDVNVVDSKTATAVVPASVVSANYTVTVTNVDKQNASITFTYTQCFPDSTCQSHEISWAACSVSCGGGTQTGTCNDGCGGTGTAAPRVCNTQSCCVPSAEVCDGKDNDCDGKIDDGLDCRSGWVRPDGTWPTGATGRTVIHNWETRGPCRMIEGACSPDGSGTCYEMDDWDIFSWAGASSFSVIGDQCDSCKQGGACQVINNCSSLNWGYGHNEWGNCSGPFLSDTYRDCVRKYDYDGIKTCRIQKLVWREYQDCSEKAVRGSRISSSEWGMACFTADGSCPTGSWADKIDGTGGCVYGFSYEFKVPDAGDCVPKGWIGACRDRINRPDNCGLYACKSTSAERFCDANKIVRCSNWDQNRKRTCYDECGMAHEETCTPQTSCGGWSGSCGNVTRSCNDGCGKSWTESTCIDCASCGSCSNSCCDGTQTCTRVCSGQTFSQSCSGSCGGLHWDGIWSAGHQRFGFSSEKACNDAYNADPRPPLYSSCGSCGARSQTKYNVCWWWIEPHYNIWNAECRP